MYEGSVCVCCMATEGLVELFAPQTIGNFEETYANIIRASFSLELSPSDGHDSVCEACTIKLRDTLTFKCQILKSVSLLTSVNVKDLVTDPVLLNLTQPKPIYSKPKLLKVKLEKEYFSEDSDDKPGADDDYFSQDSDYKPGADDEYFDDDVDDEDYEECKPKLVKLIEKTPKGETSKKNAKSKRQANNTTIRTLPFNVSPEDRDCTQCGKIFPTHKLLMMHYNEHFPNYTCDVCNKSFVSKRNLCHHKQIHLKGPFPCNKCGQVYNSINSLRSHSRYKHSSAPLYVCKKCGDRFPTINKRLDHLKQAHGIEERNHKCQYCELSFRNGDELRKHLIAKHKPKLYDCALCGHRATRYVLRRHMMNKHNIGDKKHQCTLCNKAFDRKYTLEMHMRVHTDDKKFLCKLCGKAFVQKSALSSHAKSHVKRREYDGDFTEIMSSQNEGRKESGLLETEEHLEDYDDEDLEKECKYYIEDDYEIENYITGV